MCPMFPPGLEPGTFRVLGERDNHYTTETGAEVLWRTSCAICYCKYSCDSCCNALMTEEPGFGSQQQKPMVERVALGLMEMCAISAFKFEFTSLFSLEGMLSIPHMLERTPYICRETKCEFTSLFSFEGMQCIPHMFKGIPCIGRESNPGLPRGRREFYH